MMRALIVSLAFTLSAAACGQSPTEVYTDMATSAHFGDREGFLAGFTKDSKKVIKGMIMLAEAYGMPGSSPYELLVYDEVVREDIYDKGKKFDNFKCDKKCAVLRVKSSGKKKRLLMIETDDGWRIDVKRLDKFWQTSAGRK